MWRGWGIVPTWIEWVALTQADERKQASTEGAVRLDDGKGVVRTRWFESASRAEKRGQDHLVQPDEPGEKRTDHEEEPSVEAPV